MNPDRVGEDGVKLCFLSFRGGRGQTLFFVFSVRRPRPWGGRGQTLFFVFSVRRPRPWGGRGQTWEDGVKLCFLSFQSDGPGRGEDGVKLCFLSFQSDGPGRASRPATTDGWSRPAGASSARPTRRPTADRSAIAACSGGMSRPAVPGPVPGPIRERPDRSPGRPDRDGRRPVPPGPAPSGPRPASPALAPVGRSVAGGGSAQRHHGGGSRPARRRARFAPARIRPVAARPQPAGPVLSER